MEPAAVYRAFREEVRSEQEVIPIGRAVRSWQGNDMTLVCYGAMLRPTLVAVDGLLESDGISADVIYLLTVSPIDTETITESVSRAGHAIVVHEAPRNCGVGAEIVARIAGKAFWHLEAPIRWVTGYDVRFPYFAWEKAYLPNATRIANAAREAIAF